MGYSKFIVKGSNKILLDLTQDTVKAEYLKAGITAHDQHGNPITGTLPVIEHQDEQFTITKNGTYVITGAMTVVVNVPEPEKDIAVEE